MKYEDLIGPKSREERDERKRRRHRKHSDELYNADVDDLDTQLVKVQVESNDG